MAFDPKKIRKWIAITAVLLLAVVVGFYAYSRILISRKLADIPKKLGVDIQQSTEGFSFSKSDGAHTLFKISAGKAVLLKESQLAKLNHVRIIVYARGMQKYDQIYGSEFEYDQKNGIVRAKSEVQIDLEVPGKPEDNAGKNEIVGAIHLKAKGLTFHQETGIANTDEELEFQIPQAKGRARGAQYDANTRQLTLKSDVRVKTAAEASRSTLHMNAADITATNAVLSDAPRQIKLTGVGVTQDTNRIDADRVTIRLRQDSSVEDVLAEGNVRSTSSDPKGFAVQAAAARLDLSSKNKAQSAQLTGGVRFKGNAGQPVEGKSGRLLIDFGARNQISRLRAVDNVSLSQKADGRTVDLKAPQVEIAMGAGNRLDKAWTQGASEVVITDAVQARTLITAEKFTADFAAGNKLRSIQGEPKARILSSVPGQPDRVSESRSLLAEFELGGRGGLKTIRQSGGVKLQEGPRKASAGSASFSAATDVLSLSGSPRLSDSAAGLSLSADAISFNRKSGAADARGSVKATYNQLKSSPNGALFAAADPIHVTAAEMAATRQADTARFTGNARLWQGANVVQARQIIFDRGKRSLSATGAEKEPVRSVFVQTEKTGKTTPITVRSQRLTYVDADRKARFENGVTVTAAEVLLKADQAEVQLRAAGAASSSATASQVERVVAQGGLTLEQKMPVRKATGELLVYTPADGKFVLTGKTGKTPSIFDAERGEITADSLTFYSRDDRVQVGSGESGRTVTRTRVKDETTP